MSQFWLSKNRGFFIEFSNGYQISVQWGIGTYSECGRYPAEDGKKTSSTAECAVLKNYSLISLKGSGFEVDPDNDEVLPDMNADDVLKLMNWVAKL